MESQGAWKYKEEWETWKVKIWINTVEFCSPEFSKLFKILEVQSI